MILKKTKWFIPLLAAAILVGCNITDGKTDKTAEEEQQQIHPVEIAEVYKDVLSEEIQLSGNIMASKHVVVLPLLTGEVTKVHVSNGDVVNRGDILIEVDASDIELNVAQAKAGLDAARANLAGARTMREQNMKQAQLQLEQAKDILEMLDEIEEVEIPELDIENEELAQNLEDILQTIIDSNMPSAQDRKQAERAVEQARTAVEQARSTTQIEAAEAQVRQAEIGVQMAEKQLTHATVTAPISGQITGFTTTVGEFVSPQAPLAQIVQMDQPVVRVNVTESTLPFLKRDQEVEVFIKSLNKQYDGIISYISILPAEQSRSYPVEIKIDNHDEILRVGMLAEVHIAVSEKIEQTLVPVDAIINENNETFAYVTKDGKTVERRSVTISTENPSYFAIETGLEAGEFVVVRGAHQLYDGALINIRNTENPFEIVEVEQNEADE